MLTDVIPAYGRLYKCGQDYVSKTMLLPFMRVTNVRLRGSGKFLQYDVRVGRIVRLASYSVEYTLTEDNCLVRKAIRWSGPGIIKRECIRGMRQEDKKMQTRMNEACRRR